MQVERQLNKAKKLAKQQQIEQARGIYQQILAKFPANKAAQAGLAALPLKNGQMNSLENAINGLIQHFNQQKFTQVIAEAEELMKQGINHPTIHNVLAATYVSTKQEGKAIKHFAHVLKENPNYTEGHNNLGNAYQAIGEYEKALSCFRKAIKIKPQWPEPYYNKAIALTHLGKVEDAIATYRQGLEVAPDEIKIANNLSALLNDNKRHDEAITLLSSIIEAHPNFSVAYSNRGIAYTKTYAFDKAKADFEKAAQLQADYTGYFQGYADLLIEEKDYEKSITVLRQGVDSTAKEANVFSSLLLNQCYSESEYSDEAYAYAKKFGTTINKQSATLIKNTRVHDKPNQKLRVGYVSADFRNHSVARFFEPLISSHNKNINTFCYYNAQRHDKVTKRIEQHADAWRDVFSWTDQHLLEAIQRDKLDILVDLSGHTSHNRLSVFANKAAPIQISWLGFPDTTGLPTMDYRLVDSISDPEGVGDEYHTEHLYRLPTSFLCYQGDESVDVVKTLPSESKGYITFGSFNNVRKITLEVIQAWSNILHQVEQSKLLLKSAHFSNEAVRKQYEGYFEQFGIEADRLDLVAKTDTTAEHLALYGQVDLCLDTYPYNGTTTTCEALWMGAPVVTYAGARHSARVSASILTNVGLSEWIAKDIEGYVDLAVNMANNPNKLQRLRETLREQMKVSPLCDKQRFANDMEQAYQTMWHNYMNQ